MATVMAKKNIPVKRKNKMKTSQNAHNRMKNRKFNS